MAGLLDDIYGDLLTAKQREALRNEDLWSNISRATSAAADLAMPSRAPIGWGAVLGKVGAALGGGEGESVSAIEGMSAAEKIKQARQERAILEQASPFVQEILKRRLGLLAPGTLTPGGSPTPLAPGAPAAGPLSNAPPPPPAAAGYPPVPPGDLGPAAGEYGAWSAPTGARLAPAAPGPQASAAPDLQGLLQLASASGGGDQLSGGGLLARLGGGSGGPPSPFSGGPPGAGGPDLSNIRIEQLAGEAAPAGSVAMPFPTIADPNRPRSAWAQGYTYDQPRVPFGQAPGDALPGRQGRVEFWRGQGAPQHVAEGIADRVGAESGFNPSAIGDRGTSGGLYQHHADRLTRLRDFAAKQDVPWTDPGVQDRFAATEVGGGDAIAARGWPEILAAPDRATAAKLWDRHFERSAGGPGASGSRTGIRVEPLGGEAAPVGGGASGLIPGLGVDPDTLGALDALLKMGGMKSSPFGSLLETYYKSPGYLGEKARTEEVERLRARTELEPKLQAAIAWAKIDPSINEAERRANIERYSKELEQVRGAKLESEKPTSDIKEYEFYRKEQLAAGQIPEPFGKWDINRRRAPSAAETPDTALFKARLEIDKTVALDAAKKASLANDSLPLIDEMIRLADKTPGGMAGQVASTTAKAFSALGIPVTEGMSNAEAMQALTQRMIPPLRDPGSSSDKDMSLYIAASPGLAQSVEGRLKIAAMMKAIVQRNIETADVYHETIGLPAAERRAKISALNNRPLFSEEQRAALEGAARMPATTAPSAAVPGTIHTPYGTVTPIAPSAPGTIFPIPPR